MKHESSERYRTMPIKECLQQQGAIDMPHRKALLAAMKGESFGSVLEIGCSVGAMIGTIYRTFGGINCEGFDFNEEAIQYAQEHYRCVKFTVLDAADMAGVYKPGQFDVVFSCSVLMHLGPKLYRQVCKDIVGLKPSLIYHVEVQGRERMCGKADTPEHFKRSHDYIGTYHKLGCKDIRQTPVEQRDLTLITVRGAA